MVAPTVVPDSELSDLLGFWEIETPVWARGPELLEEDVGEMWENGRDAFSLYSLLLGWREEGWVVIQTYRAFQL